MEGNVVTLYLAGKMKRFSVDPREAEMDSRKPACSQLPAPRLAPAMSACGLARPQWDKGRSF